MGLMNCYQSLPSFPNSGARRLTPMADATLGLGVAAVDISMAPTLPKGEIGSKTWSDEYHTRRITAQVFWREIWGFGKT